MSHQQKAFDKLKDIKVMALFMDMGTGKTRTVLEFIEYRLSSQKLCKVFWVCPVSCKNNLQKDIIKHSHYTTSCIEKYTNELVCIIGIESLSSSDRCFFKLKKLLEENPNNMLIIDESHMMKNHQAKRTERINKYLRPLSKYRVVMTGTPVTQGIWDLFSQMYFLHPKILGYKSFHTFAANHLEYSEVFVGKIEEAHNTEYITQKLNPYCYQVTKKECLDLPEKSYTYKFFYLDYDAEYYYNVIKDYYINQIDSERPEKISFIIFSMLNRLHRLVSGEVHCVVDTGSEARIEIDYKDYSRVETLIETLEEIDLKNNKCIIWYKYNTDLELITDKLKLKYTVINGNINQKQRDKNIEEFKVTDTNILIINIASGSYGLNLQEANYMIYYNNTFDYAKRIQSEDRIYRIGQTKNCHIIDIISDTPIDIKIDDSIVNKSSLAKEIREEINKIKDDKEKIELYKQRLRGEF